MSVGWVDSDDVLLTPSSIAAAKVWTYLSRVVVRCSSPCLLVVVAIKRVSTMQLFVQEAVSMAYYSFPIDGTNWWCRKSLVSHMVLTCLRQPLCNTKKKREDLVESTSVVPAEYPSKVKLKNFHNSRVIELG